VFIFEKLPADLNKLNLLAMRFCVLVSLLLLSVAGSFSQNISGVVNVYSKVLWADSAKGSVKLANVSGFGAYVGHKVMLVQMKGATIDQANSASYGSITAIKEAGYYEIGTICGFVSDTMIFERKFNNFYDVTGYVQCVIFPKYTADVTVTDTLKAQAWDSTAGTGGIIALEVPGSIFLNKPIYADGKGFKGGEYLNYSSGCSFTPGTTNYFMAYNASGTLQGGKKGEGITVYNTGQEYGRGKLATGGGGGNRFNAGGAGGSNYGTGGLGGNRIAGACQSNSQAEGGLSLSSYYSQGRIFFGGGGGGGHSNDDYGLGGGDGGGIVYIKAAAIVANAALPADNKISANGARPSRILPAGSSPSNASSSDGSGGGGGGGTLIINVPAYTGNITVEATGAKGGDSEVGGNLQCCGPGGGGGGGVIQLSLASTPVNLSTNTLGGANGVSLTTFASCPVGSANAATAGSAGTTSYNFTLAAPKDSSPVCTQLVPLYTDVAISGYQQGNMRYITATVSNKENIQQCLLQQSFTGTNFLTIAAQSSSSYQYYFTDAAAPGKAVVYRIKVVTKDGGLVYSPVLRMGTGQKDKLLSVSVFPNPSRQKVSVQVYSAKAESGEISIVNAQGSILRRQKQFLSKGYNVVSLSLNDIPGGVFFLKVTTAGSNAVQALVKLAY
jgi:hypothetical protein